MSAMFVAISEDEAEFKDIAGGVRNGRPWGTAGWADVELLAEVQKRLGHRNGFVAGRLSLHRGAHRAHRAHRVMLEVITIERDLSGNTVSGPVYALIADGSGMSDAEIAANFNKQIGALDPPRKDLRPPPKPSTSTTELRAAERVRSKMRRRSEAMPGGRAAQ